MMHPRLLGAILAGGESRRFGSDKALARWRGQRLIDHVADRLTTVVDTLVIVGGARDGFVAVADWPRAGLGPLGGIAGALAHAATHGFAAVVTLPCDTPEVPDSLLRTLAGAAGAAVLEGLPVAGRWPAALAGSLADWLDAAEDRSMRAWTAAIGATAIPHAPLANINRPADLAALA
jgi:molybdopterin-guanine dinucleotide biosynthesis protein A